MSLRIEIIHPFQNLLQHRCIHHPIRFEHPARVKLLRLAWLQFWLQLVKNIFKISEADFGLDIFFMPTSVFFQWFQSVLQSLDIMNASFEVMDEYEWLSDFLSESLKDVFCVLWGLLLPLLWFFVEVDDPVLNIFETGVDFFYFLLESCLVCFEVSNFICVDWWVFAYLFNISS